MSTELAFITKNLPLDIAEEGGIKIPVRIFIEQDINIDALQKALIREAWRLGLDISLHDDKESDCLIFKWQKSKTNGRRVASEFAPPYDR